MRCRLLRDVRWTKYHAAIESFSAVAIFSHNRIRIPFFHQWIAVGIGLTTRNLVPGRVHIVAYIDRVLKKAALDSTYPTLKGDRHGQHIRCRRTIHGVLLKVDIAYILRRVRLVTI